MVKSSGMIIIIIVFFSVLSVTQRCVAICNHADKILNEPAMKIAQGIVSICSKVTYELREIEIYVLCHSVAMQAC